MTIVEGKVPSLSEEEVEMLRTIGAVSVDRSNDQDIAEEDVM